MKIWNVDNSGLCLSQLWTAFYYNGENATMSDFMPVFACLHVAICVSACWVGSRGAVNNSWGRKDDFETVGVFIQPHLWFCFIISLPSSLSLMRNKGPRGAARNPQRENPLGHGYWRKDLSNYWPNRVSHTTGPPGAVFSTYRSYTEELWLKIWTVWLWRLVKLSLRSLKCFLSSDNWSPNTCLIICF